MALRLIHNTLFGLEGCELIITDDKSRLDKMLVALVVHIIVAVLCAKDSSILHPLRELLIKPRSMAVRNMLSLFSLLLHQLL